MKRPDVPSRPARLIRAVAAFAALLVLLVGVPATLAAAAGWPLPTAWPNGDELRFAARGGLGDLFWMKAFAIVVWVAWVQLAYAVLAEIAAAVRHRAPSTRSGWAAAVAGRLIGALVVGSAAVGPVSPAAAAPAPADAIATQVASLARPAALPLGPGPGPAAAVADPAPGHLVVRGETLSSIAEDELGTPAAWPYLWETNRGRVYGDRVFDDPDLILPGWELAVPRPSPTTPSPAPAGASAVGAGGAVVAAPDVPSAPARAVLLPPLVVSAIDDRVPAIGADAGRAGARPGAGVASADDPTATAAPATKGHAAGADVSAAAESAMDTGDPGPGPAAVAGDDAAPAWARFSAFAGASLLATGATAMLVSSRRRALRSRNEPLVVAPVEGELADAVTALAAGTESVALARLELALRVLAGQLGRSGSEARPVAVRRMLDGLEVALDRPATLDAPWRRGERDTCWELPSWVPLASLVDDARAVAPPCPALVGIGRDEAGWEVYVDLEAAGVVSFGPEGGAVDALRMVAASMAVTPLAEELRIIAVAEAMPELEGRHDVHVVPDLAAAVAEVERVTAAIATVSGGRSSTFRLRAIAGYEPWEPAVVVVTGPPTDEEAWRALTGLVAAHRGVAVVGTDLPAWPGAPVVAHADGCVSVAGWRVRPHGLSEHEVEVLAAALETAAQLVDVTARPAEAAELGVAADRVLDRDAPLDPDAPLGLIDGPGRGDQESPADSADQESPADPAAPGGLRARAADRPDVGAVRTGGEASEPTPPWSLMVRVLGPVDVVAADGGTAEFDRPKALELVVWLAQHPHTSTRSGARAALWEADVSNASFSNVVSDARKSLARLLPPPDGQEWLGRTYAERLPLHPGVVLDADLVRAHLVRARQLPEEAAISELRQALGLVRGAPYAGKTYLWPDAEALPSTLTLLVTSVAAELGQRLLDRGDVEGVLQASAVGLDVLPGHEELVALRLRAHAARGDRAALRREYACYEQSLLSDPWAGDPAPELVELFHGLVHPVPVAGD